MDWIPKNAVVDQIKIAENLLQFIRANQKDALTWANDGAYLKEFVAIHNSASGRADTVFPVLMLTASRIITAYDSDILSAVWQTEIEIAVTDVKADAVTVKAQKYAEAVESMILNIPPQKLCENTNRNHYGYLNNSTKEFDVLRQRSNNEFLQIVVLTGEFIIQAAAR